mgnify:CR=1 FL=1|tara:strand:+ start:4754 stop:6406 length:1653 start_codon:yes stop_codon:yes gene_type:complete
MEELTADSLLKRYNEAQGTMDMWMNVLQSTYDLVIPNQGKFANRERLPGQIYTNHVYDWTAVTAAQKYASNLMSNLMPTGTQWANFKPGTSLAKPGEEAPQEVKEVLQFYQDTLFSLLNRSNFNLAAHQSLTEMSISTGVLLINEGPDKDHPVSFTSVPLHEVSFEGNTGTGEIKNVYRKFKLPGEYITTTWPAAQLGAETLAMIERSPTVALDVIECTVFHEDLPKDKQWCYTVLVEATKDMIIQDYRSYSPWIIFRPHVYSGELLGRGVMLNMLAAIRTLNRLAEDELRLNTFLSKPIFLSASGSGALNPYTTKISPGSIIPFQSENSSGQPPISQLTIQGNLQYSQLNRQEIKQELISALGINPVSPSDSPGKTATEMRLVDADWQRSNQELAGRLQRELCFSVLDKCFRICSRFGYWKALHIDGKHIDIEFVSPINDYQSTIDVQKVVSYAQTMNEVLGPQGAMQGISYGLDATKLPTWIAEKMHLPVDIIRDALGRQEFMQQIQQQQQPQQGESPNGQQQQPGQPGLGQVAGATQSTEQQGTPGL